LSTKSYVNATRFLAEAEAAFKAAEDKAKAAKMSQYMRNKFEYHGLSKPERTKIQKELFESVPNLFGKKKDSKEANDDYQHDAILKELEYLVMQLWEKEEREYQYLAIDILVKGQTLKPKPVVLPLSSLERLVREKPWWDTVDLIASKLVGHAVQLEPKVGKKTMDEWIQDDHMWIRRTAIIHQLNYKTETDTKRLFAYAEARMHEEEFFIRKAIGWALRQYARVDPKQVREFTKKNKSSLSTLSYREAMKHL